MSENLDLLQRVGIPVLSLVAGWLGAAYRIHNQIEKRIATTERELVSLKAGCREELDELASRLSSMDHSVGRLNDSSHDFAKDAELAQFVMEQNDRWQRIQRTLGRIEGLMDRPLNDSTPPPPRPNPPRRSNRG